MYWYVQLGFAVWVGGGLWAEGLCGMHRGVCWAGSLGMPLHGACGMHFNACQSLVGNHHSVDINHWSNHWFGCG